MSYLPLSIIFFFISALAYIVINLLDTQYCIETASMTDSPIYDTKGYDTFQAYLDEDRYSYSHILRYEKIFGEDYVSTGGPVTTKVSLLTNTVY